MEGVSEIFQEPLPVVDRAGDQEPRSQRDAVCRGTGVPMSVTEGVLLEAARGGIRNRLGRASARCPVGHMPSILDSVLCGEADASFVAAQGCGESEKGQVVAGMTFVAGAESSIAQQPGHGPLDDPPPTH